MPLGPDVFHHPRMRRIFRTDGKALIVAMDHGNFMNVNPALEDPSRVVEEVVSSGADAILTTFGIAKTYPSSFGRAGLLLRVDGGLTSLSAGGGEEWPLRFSVEDALRLGADGVGCMGFPGSRFETQTMNNLAHLASDCRDWGILLLAEMLPGGFENLDAHTPENIAMASRLGVEAGADLIKTKFTGSSESFRRVVDGCYRPVVILGGDKARSEVDVLRSVKEAVDCGGAGVVMGRNIWQNRSPGKFTAALFSIIHESASVEDALKLLD